MMCLKPGDHLVTVWGLVFQFDATAIISIVMSKQKFEQITF